MWKTFNCDSFLGSLSKCADTKQIRTAGSQSNIFGFDFDFTCSQMQESNPGQMGEKHERFLWAMLSPLYCDSWRFKLATNARGYNFLSTYPSQRFEL